MNNQNDEHLTNFSTNTLKDIPRIRVIVRKRPLSKKEQTKNDMDIIEIKSTSNLIVKELK